MIIFAYGFVSVAVPSGTPAFRLRVDGGDTPLHRIFIR